jgi:hypothetical protein
MNGSAVKAKRRELRRAVGPAVVDTVVETGRNVEALAARLEHLKYEHGRRLNELKFDFDIDRSIRFATADRVSALEALGARGFRAFFGRLAWLLFGR